MTSLAVLHPTTKKQLDHFIGQPSHALLLVGPRGIGKTFLAEIIAAQVIGLAHDTLRQHPYYAILSPDGSSISIDAVRDIQRFLQLKTIGQGGRRRAVIVEHADSMTTEAQNAFLKILEEPPSDTLLLMTADSKRSLLPTILSRCQTISVQPPHEADIRAFFAGQTGDISPSYMLSGGMPGLLHALLASDTTHPLAAGVSNAKVFLQQTAFERLVSVDSLSKHKEQALAMVEALQYIAHTGLNQAVTRSDQARLRRWHLIQKSAHRARVSLGNNTNTKLVLTHLALHI